MKKEIRERLQNPDLDHLDLARQGIVEGLAAHIEAGGTLHPETRQWLASYLRGELPAKRDGRKRRPEKMLEDYRIWRAVLQEEQNNGGQRYKAIEVVSAAQQLPSGTVRSAFKRMNDRIEPHLKPRE